jgi:hypothetical protein
VAATVPDHTGWTPGAGWPRAKQALGWPDLDDDDPCEVAEFEEDNRRAQATAGQYWREHAA